MLLHIYVQKIHFESPPSDAMASFLSVHSGAFEYCVSSVYYRGGSALFDQVVHVPIPSDKDTTTKVTLIASIFMKNGIFEPQGKCTFITSPLEHGVTKRLSLFGRGGALLSHVELTASFYAAPITDGVWNGSSGNPDGALTDRFRREYDFLMARKRNWGDDRPTTWRGDHEALLGVPSGVSSGSRRAGRMQTPRASPPDTVRRAWAEPKLRKTCMAVGYVNFWPSQKDAQSNEDKIMLKLHLAEQRRLRLLRDTEERARERNRADSRGAEAARRRQAQSVGDAARLRRILAEKERELQRLRKSVAASAATHRDFYSYHHTHSAVESNKQTAILGPRSKCTHSATVNSQGIQTQVKSTRKISLDSKSLALRRVSKRSGSKKKKIEVMKASVAAEKPTAGRDKSKVSRIKSRREDQKRKLKSSSVDGSGCTRVVKKILDRSQRLQQRLGESWRSDGAGDEILIKLSKLRADSTDSSSVEEDTSGQSVVLGNVSESMLELRQSFREALDLTARKVKRQPKQESSFFTRTVFIPTSNNLRLEMPNVEASAHEISGIRSSIDITNDVGLSNRERPISQMYEEDGDSPRAHITEARHPPVVTSADDANTSIYENLLMAIGPSSSDSDSGDASGLNQRLHVLSTAHNRAQKESRSRKPTQTTNLRKSLTRQSVISASTSSSQSKRKAAPVPKVAHNAISKSSIKKKQSPYDSGNAEFRSSYLQLLSSDSKDISEEARRRFLLFGGDDVTVDYDYESTMARLLSTTPLASRKVEEDINLFVDPATPIPEENFQEHNNELCDAGTNLSLENAKNIPTAAAAEEFISKSSVDYTSQIGSVGTTVQALEEKIASYLMGSMAVQAGI